VHDECTEHSSHLLHRHVRVVEVRAFLMDIELIDESAARLYWFLADARHAIHAVRNFEAVPVHRRWLRKMIVEDDAYMVALIHLNCGPWSAPVEAPGVNRLQWADLLFHYLGDQVEDHLCCHPLCRADLRCQQLRRAY